MSYLINEIFYTLQGEGVHTGRPAVFVRFARCNLWTGRETDRATALCQFCDTDFTHGTRYTLPDLMTAITNLSPQERHRTVVLTGGEPTLQADAALIAALHGERFYVAMETNGTRKPPPCLDWICVSPKAGAVLEVRRGDELKVVYPQPGLDLDEMRKLDFKRYWLSPMDGPHLAENTAAAIDYVLAHPEWQLNIQTHKVIGVR